MLKNDPASDRTSDHGFLVNHVRLFFACGAYVLHHALWTNVLVNTELAQAQPANRDPEAVQDRRARGAVQRSRQAAAALQLPGQSAPASPHRDPVPDPSTNACAQALARVPRRSTPPPLMLPPAWAGSPVPVCRQSPPVEVPGASGGHRHWLTSPAARASAAGLLGSVAVKSDYNGRFQGRLADL